MAACQLSGANHARSDFDSGACLCWAIDNNLTRQVSAGEPLFIAGGKGLVSGVVNISAALFLGATSPSWLPISYALLVGYIGYGVSLVLFVLALRGHQHKHDFSWGG